MSQRCRLPILFLLFVMLLASACATSIAKTEPTTTLSPTATPVLTPPPLTIKPAHPLTWTAHQLPPGLKLTPYNWDGPALAQSDGDTAYLCDLANGQAQVWATHDRAAHWIVVGSVPVASGVTSCDYHGGCFSATAGALADLCSRWPMLRSGDWRDAHVPDGRWRRNMGSARPSSRGDAKICGSRHPGRCLVCPCSLRGHIALLRLLLRPFHEQGWHADMDAYRWEYLSQEWRSQRALHCRILARIEWRAAGPGHQ